MYHQLNLLLISFFSSALLKGLPYFILCADAASSNEYEVGEVIPIKVNALRSTVTHTPYDFYYAPYPRPPQIISDHENLGKTLLGEKSDNSLYNVVVLRNTECTFVNTKPLSLSKTDKTKFSYLIDNRYINNWSCGNIPATTRLYSEDGMDETYRHGFEVGSVSRDEHILYTHLNMHLHYKPSDTNPSKYKIVRFEVSPRSYLYESNTTTEVAPQCKEVGAAVLETLEEPLHFTYSVHWEVSTGEVESIGLQKYSEIAAYTHWFSIVNALIIVVFLGGIVTTVLVRALLKDIARYNSSASVDELSQEEWGWKLSHGDVFRKPKHFAVLASCAGTAVQIFGSFTLILLLAVLGFITTDLDGQFIQAILGCFCLMGFPAGYVTALFTKLFYKEPFRALQPILLTAFHFPGLCFAVFAILNAYLWGSRSSAALPVSSFALLISMWLGICCPLVFLGYRVGYMREVIRLPVSTNKIPREIPPQNCIKHPIVFCMLGGLLPFGAIFTELLFLLTSFWLRQFYLIFGFLLFIFLILIITCAEISISFTYFRLVSEDYLWWWKSFFYSASSGVYVFAYAAFYFFNNLSIEGFVPTSLYFGYMLLFSYAFALLTGGCGFIATFVFLRLIYGSVKVD